MGGAGGGTNGLTTGWVALPDLPDLRLGRSGAEGVSDFLSLVGTKGLAAFTAPVLRI